jgi:hypothetical protein
MRANNRPAAAASVNDTPASCLQPVRSGGFGRHTGVTIGVTLASFFIGQSWNSLGACCFEVGGAPASIPVF